jgi:hypothetical protein
MTRVAVQPFSYRRPAGSRPATGGDRDAAIVPGRDGASVRHHVGDALQVGPPIGMPVRTCCS